jgi:hypothetical protein
LLLAAYPLAHAPRQAAHVETSRWPRVEVRILGGEDLIHWVLLDTTSLEVTIRPHDHTPVVTDTEMAPRPKALSPRQLETLRTVFEPQLA